MTFAEISTLLDKGFSPDQIMQLSGTTEPEEKKPEPEEKKPEPEEKKPEPEEKTSVSAGDELIQSFKDMVSGLAAEFQELKKTMQETNIRTESRDAGTNTGENAFDVLAGLIRPPFEEKKER